MFVECWEGEAKCILMYYDLYYERKREAGCTFSSNVLVDEKKENGNWEDLSTSLWKVNTG